MSFSDDMTTLHISFNVSDHHLYCLGVCVQSLTSNINIILKLLSKYGVLLFCDFRKNTSVMVGWNDFQIKR